MRIANCRGHQCMILVVIAGVIWGSLDLSPVRSPPAETGVCCTEEESNIGRDAVETDMDDPILGHR